MKLLLLLIFVSCAGTGKQTSSVPKGETDYLKRFETLKSQLDKQKQVCLQESKAVLVRPIIERTVDEKHLQFQFINSRVKNLAIKRYDPKKYDWALKAKIKSLYLDYPFDEAISQKHYEISNALNDCANDFDHLNFLKALINEWEKNPSRASESKKVLRRYFSFLENNEVPPLATLILDHIVQTLHEKELIKINNIDEYIAESKKIETFYTNTGRNILLNFKDQNYSDIYKSDKKMVKNFNHFKKFIFKSVTL